MSAEFIATMRNRVGKGAARELRREGLIPAVIYGDKQPPVAISLSAKDVTKKIHSGGFLSRTLEVEVDGKNHKVIPRDYQRDPVRDFVVHVDFLRIGANSRLNIEVPVHFLNEELSPGLKKGGVLNIVRHTVEVSCPASAIPESFEIDLAEAEVGDSIHASAVTLPANVTLTITDRDFTIATIASPSALRSEENADEDEVEGEESEEAATDEE